MKRFIAGLLLFTLLPVAIEGRSVRERQEVVKNKYFDRSIPDKEDSLTAEDFENGKKLSAEEKASTPNGRIAGMENPNMFEGDIANEGLNSTTILRFLGRPDSKGQPDGVVHNAIRGTFARWPGAVIPYTISSQYSSQARSVIADAIRQFETKTCIRIKARTSERDYIHIVPENGCYSIIGKRGGRQTLSLGDDCVHRNVVMHELMHAVGFFHEQSRPDRDQYVEVLYQNVKNEFKFNFDKQPLSKLDYLGQPYDYNSIMHYQSRLFSSNGQETIRPVASARARGVKLGMGADFTPTDIRELKIIAQCK